MVVGQRKFGIVSRQVLLGALALLVMASAATALGIQTPAGPVETPTLPVPAPPAPADTIPISGSAGFWANGAAYFVGGQTRANGGDTPTDGDIPLASIFTYVPGGQLVVAAALPFPLSHASVAFDGTDAYIFGGTSDGLTPVATILRYHPGDEAAVVLTAQLPQARLATSAVYDGSAFHIFGGETFSTSWQTVATITRFDPASGTVANTGLLPVAVRGTTAVWTGDMAILMGGVTSQRTLTAPLSETATRTTAIIHYWPGQGVALTAAATLPQPVGWSSSYWDGSYAYMLGGRTNSASTTAVLRYNPCVASVQAVTAMDVPARHAMGLAYDGVGTAYLLGGKPTTGAYLTGVATYTTPASPSARCTLLGEPAKHPSSAVLDGDTYIFGGNTGNTVSAAVSRFEPGVGSSRVADLPSGRDATSAVTIGAEAFVFGGRGATTNTAEIVRYSPGAGMQLGGNLPSARYGTSAVTDGTVAYIFGGATSSGYLADIVRYDPATQTSTTLNLRLPTARIYTSAIWDDGHAYIFGGWDGTQSLDDVLRFTPAEGTLEVLPVKLVGGARHAMAAVSDNEHGIYLFGGISSSPLSTVHRFDTCAGTFASAPALAAPRGRATAVSDGAGTAYILGGVDAAGVVPSAFHYALPPAPVTGPCVTWASTNLPSPLARPSAVWAGDRALVFGGETGSGGQPPSSFVFEYRAGGLPAQVANLPTAATSTSAVWTGESAYVFGGWTGSSRLNTVVKYTPGSAPTVVATLPVAIDSTSAVWDGTYAYIFGGRTSSGDSSGILRFDPATNTVTTHASRLPGPRAETSAALVDGFAYILGGFDETMELSQVVRFDPNTGVVQLAPALSSGRAYAAVASDGADSVRLFGGRLAGGLSSAMQAYQPCSGITSSMGTLPAGMERMAAVHDGAGHILLIGGRPASGTPTSAITSITISPIADSGTCVGPTRLVAGVARASAVWTPNGALVFGGETGSNGEPPSTPVQAITAQGVVDYVANLPAAATSTSAVWTGNAAYVFGGWTGDVHMNSIVRYTPGGNAVRVGSLPEARDSTSAVWDGTYAYIFGGHVPGSKSDDILRFNPATGTTTRLAASLPTARAETTAVWFGDSAYIIGGYDGVRNLDEIVRFTPATGEVAVVADLPTGRAYAAASTDGVYGIDIFGGRTSSGLTDSWLRFTPCSGSVSTAGRTAYSVERAAAVFDPTTHQAFVIGGRSGGSPLASILRLTVPDGVPAGCMPVIEAPTALSVEATSSEGALADYSVTASAAGEQVPVSCAPASGSQFPLGDTTVSCTATSSWGFSSSASFTVTVVDTTPPALPVLGDLVLEATGPDGAMHPLFLMGDDLVDGPVLLACSSDLFFPFGTTLVDCTATDSRGNVAAGSFNVTVQDTTAPQIGFLAPQAVWATSASGGTATFDPFAYDVVDGTTNVTCDAASGSMFPLGTTWVTCASTDAAGNTATADFPVTVTYDWAGFSSPIDGQAISRTSWRVAFSLAGESAGVTDAEARLYVAPVVDGIVGEETPATSTRQADNLMAYRQGDYRYRWDTGSLDRGEWQLRVDLGDGVVRTVNVVLV